LQSGDRAKTIATDGTNPFATATAVHFRAFLDALEKGEVPRATARDNRNTLALVFAAYESAQLGRAIEVSQYEAV
jgi:predicted dehydrogenase